MLLAIEFTRPLSKLLLTITLLISTVGGCDFYYPLAVDQVQTIQNEEFPKFYKPDLNCRWTISAIEENSFIYLACTEVNLPFLGPVTPPFVKTLLGYVLDLSKGKACTGDKLVISSTGFDDAQVKCGVTGFDVQSQGNELIMELIGKLGGKFTCTATSRQHPRLARSTSEPDCECGQRQILDSSTVDFLDDRIVSGDDVLPHEFPFFVAFTDTSRSVIEESQFCGGSLISPKHVLTAAHCFHNREIENLKVVAGAHNITDDTDDHRQTASVEKTIIHSDFDIDILQDDIAIAELKEDLVINEYVSVVCLPFSMRDDTFLGRTVTAIGFGQTDFSEGNAEILQKVYLDIFQCISNIPISFSHICTFSNEGKDTCIADSGGPILYITSGMKTFVIGLVSYGEGCGGDFPSVNTRVTEYLDWIVEQTPDVFYCIA